MNDKNTVKEFEDPYRVKAKPRVLREAVYSISIYLF